MSGAGSILSSLLGGGKKGGGAQKDTEVMSEPPDLLKASQGTYIFHRNVYRNLLRIALVQSLTAIALIVIALWIILTATPQDRFFVSSVGGRIDSVMPLDVPLMDDNELFSRAATDIANVMSFGFLDYEQRRIQYGQQFDPATLSALQNALIGAGGIAQMGQQGIVYVAEVDPSRGGGISLKRVNADFVYEWVVVVPIKLTAKRGLQLEEQSVTPWTVSVLVQRARKLEVNNGYLIAKLLGAQADGPAQPVPPAAPEPGAVP